MKSGRVLDAEEATALHESLKSAFSYMIKIVIDSDISCEQSLTESAADSADWKNKENTVAQNSAFGIKQKDL